MSLIEIILRAKNGIRESPVINALWLEGSYVAGTFDENSDIDVWIDILPGQHKEALIDFKRAVEEVAELRSVSEITMYSNEPRLAKAKLYLEGYADDNRIELDIQESARDFVFDRQKHDIVILFDKNGTIKYGN